MPLSRTKLISILAAAALMVVAGIALVTQYSSGSDENARRELLRLVPSNSSAVIFLDLDQFRASPFLARLYSWAPHPAEDSEYAQFVRDTGFSYERDLKRAVVAVSHLGATTNLLAIADGKFDRGKMEAFLHRNGKSTQQGKWRVFLLHASVEDRPLSMAFLSDSRIAITDSENLSAVLSSPPAESGRSEWEQRFERLAGTPIFAVIREDSTLQNALSAAAPDGFRSPALATLLNQLQWISIAGKPDGDVLRVVGEGECLSDPTTIQLRDFLKGALLLAQNGLNDPKLRQQMNPEEREAYLEILKNADVQRMDRGDWKSVRVVFFVTPRFLDVARIPPPTTAPDQAASPPEKSKKKPDTGKSKAVKKQ